MSGRHFLFVPGPTNVPERILRAMDRAQDDHRSSAFPALTRGLLADLPKVFGSTRGRAFIFPASGTGMWEASIVNALSPGDRVLAVRNGQFGHLFIDTAQRLGMKVEVLDVEWGRGIDAAAVGEALKADKSRAFKAVLVVHNDTSTGVTSDIAAVRRAMDDAGHDALLMVDGVSSIASLDFRMDEWGVDFAISGSQKGFMMPAGLGLLCVSPKGLQACETARSPRAFFDLRDHIAQNDMGTFPYTPAGSHLHGLRASLDMLLEEGMPNVAARHRRLAEGVRRAVHAWGLDTCAREPGEQSDTVTAVVVPEGADSEKVRDIAFRRYNLALGAGLGQVRGKVFRIGHLGDLNELMLLGALAGVEMTLADAGIPVKLGCGIGAAQAWYRANPPR
ncbi:MAG TPA: aminotransferase class V-fold PLP-dependent enzyme [Gemmatimonadaceae bacterium]|nr:aminotransferase class V-fold PLP-dependent enzyme [Gemmatimonadaceae bacterium]